MSCPCWRFPRRWRGRCCISPEYEGGGVHFLGPSSKARRRCCASRRAFGGGATRPAMFAPGARRRTDLEGAAAGATDTALILDELGQIDARELAAALYMLANGAGKARAHRDGALREPRTWRVMSLSSGEVPLTRSLSRIAAGRSRAGQFVRMLDIPADRARLRRVRQCRPGRRRGGARQGVQARGGVRLRNRRAGIRAAADCGRRDAATTCERSSTNSSRRMSRPARTVRSIRAAQRLGLIAAAGELATAFGLTGWREGEARAAAAWALKQWIEGRGGTEPAEARQAVEQVRHFIEAHGEARFDNLDDPDAKPVNNRAGWRKGAGEERRLADSCRKSGKRRFAPASIRNSWRASWPSAAC